MRVVVIGVGKSGTTALVYAIKSAMPADTQLLFEPRKHVVVQGENVAAKVLLNPLYPLEDRFHQQFQKKVLIIRDPRDLLISMALYRVWRSEVLVGDAAKLERYVELLREKESVPRQVSLTRINAILDEMAGPTGQFRNGIAALFEYAAKCHEAIPDCFVCKYEDMVENRLEPVARHLGLSANAMKTHVPAEYGRVARSRRAGNWRDWFCEEDIEHYRPLLLPYMTRYGYADEWALNSRPAIRPEECSEYVLRLVRERREKGGFASS